ncbi:hypothetical protein M231_00819 [Tremella mesenterica]|uniref:Uncharacterized protein n=1 Tax=Tremella mesenterica TaxID=5217 RepID=A0A4Q1BUV2_TREME|nr:hypothetical protein M231_00819 [Tremella mesenterica]
MCAYQMTGIGGYRELGEFTLFPFVVVVARVSDGECLWRDPKGGGPHSGLGPPIRTLGVLNVAAVDDELSGTRKFESDVSGEDDDIGDRGCGVPLNEQVANVVCPQTPFQPVRHPLQGHWNSGTLYRQKLETAAEL